MLHEAFWLPLPAMAAKQTKTRFAPSPTGDLHVGNVRTALFNYLLARGCEGLFVLRSEDTDRERSSEASLASICHDLEWLGLNWDEGPDTHEPAGPYRQSERDAIYHGLYEQLGESGQVYPCFCSPETLAGTRREQMAAGKPPRYPGTCDGLSDEEIEKRIAAAESPTLRFRVPGRGAVEFCDLAKGQQRFALADIGDFVIRRANGTPSFFFSNAVDDALMGISDVLRGEDHLANTPRQMLLLDTLNLDKPRYGHLALVVGDKGSPLSKRQNKAGEGSLAVADLRDAGYLPLAIVNYLARLGTVIPSNDLLTLDQLAGEFDVARLGRSPAQFDNVQLDHWQKETLHAMDGDAIRAWMNSNDQLAGTVPDDDMEAFIDTVQDNVLLHADVIAWSHRIFDELPQLDAGCDEILQAAGDAFFATALEVLDAEPDYTGFLSGVKSVAGVGGKALFRPLRIAMTGTPQGPEMAKLYDLLGAARLRRRLEQAREICSGSTTV